jgi:pyruvate/2-oxoglutarate dehydrogenase complex dihydrolipoamide acyltransferase (E2) component|tara:strand:+ start:226 stop:864 length:639 start_codon:yes stop_codon:yes gene_type:complete
MATSSAILSQIIDELLLAKPGNREGALKHLAEKGLLPKMLLKVPKEKKVTIFASKQAEDYAEANNIVVPEDFKGTAANDKISVKDLKKLTEPVKKVVNASPSAQQFCRDNGIDIDTITGTGTDGKVLLKDAQASIPNTETKEETKTDKLKISPRAAKTMKQYSIDEEDLDAAGIKGTGKNGTVLEKDLAELVKEMKESETEETTDEESADED